MRLPLRCNATLLLCALAFPAAASPWYTARDVLPPRGNRVYICHGYGCRIVTPVQFSDADIGRIAAKLGKSADAAAERAAVAGAVQAFETVVGKRVGTSGDLPGMQFGSGKADQLDCIDEATNTTSLLKLLAAEGRLKYHIVREPRARGFFLDGRYPHATAVIRDTDGADWAVDSWPGANGAPPVVQPLKAWFAARRSTPS